MERGERHKTMYMMRCEILLTKMGGKSYGIVWHADSVLLNPPLTVTSLPQDGDIVDSLHDKEVRQVHNGIPGRNNLFTGGVINEVG